MRRKNAFLTERKRTKSGRIRSDPAFGFPGCGDIDRGILVPGCQVSGPDPFPKHHDHNRKISSQGNTPRRFRSNS